MHKNEHRDPHFLLYFCNAQMAADKGDAKGALTKRTFKEVLSTPAKKSTSPARKQPRQAAEAVSSGPSNASAASNSDIMDAINAALDSKLDQLATRIEAMVTSKIDELEKKFQNVEKEMEKLKDDVNESINHVEDLLRQDIDQTWEYAVRNEQYSRKNNLHVLSLEEEEGENLEEKFIKLVGENLQEEVSADEIEIIHRIGAPKNERDRGSRRDTRPRPVIVKLQSHKTKIKIILKRKLLKGKGYVINCAAMGRARFLLCTGFFFFFCR